MTALRHRLAALDPQIVDAALAAVIAVEIEIELQFYPHVVGAHRVVSAVAAALFAMPVAVRRRWPAGALIACGVIAVVEGLLSGRISAANGVIVVPILVAYTAGAHLDPRRGLLAAASAAAGVFTGFVVLFPMTSHSAGALATAAVFVCMLFFAPWAAGHIVRDRSRRVAAFGELAERAAAERERRERDAIARERVRVGRELQEIIAESVIAMIVQAGAARRLLANDPALARVPIQAVEHTGREALADLRRVLGMLRRDDDARALSPQPGLDQLETLLAAMRRAGLECAVDGEDEAIELTPGIDLVAFRVIEAALRCAADHGSTRAAVTVRRSQRDLDLDIRADRPAPNARAELGEISDRVALYDGRLIALPAAAGGFSVSARLPLTVRA